MKAIETAGLKTGPSFEATWIIPARVRTTVMAPRTPSDVGAVALSLTMRMTETKMNVQIT